MPDEQERQGQPGEGTITQRLDVVFRDITAQDFQDRKGAIVRLISTIKEFACNRDEAIPVFETENPRDVKGIITHIPRLLEKAFLGDEQAPPLSEEQIDEVAREVYTRNHMNSAGNPPLIGKVELDLFRDRLFDNLPSSLTECRKLASRGDRLKEGVIVGVSGALIGYVAGLALQSNAKIGEEKKYFKGMHALYGAVVGFCMSLATFGLHSSLSPTLVPDFTQEQVKNLVFNADDMKQRRQRVVEVDPGVEEARVGGPRLPQAEGEIGR